VICLCQRQAGRKTDPRADDWGTLSHACLSVISCMNACLCRRQARRKTDPHADDWGTLSHACLARRRARAAADRQTDRLAWLTIAMAPRSWCWKKSRPSFREYLWPTGPPLSSGFTMPGAGSATYAQVQITSVVPYSARCNRNPWSQ
jgi:hypothetical protein